MTGKVDVDALLKQHPVPDRIQALQVREAFDHLLHGSELAGRSALATLVSLGKTAEPFLLAVLADSSTQVTQIALEGLVGIRSDHLLEVIADLLKSENVELRMAALRATNGQPQEQIRPLLLQGLRDPSPLLRRRVLSYLAWCDASWARLEILDRCDDSDVTVRWAAVEALMSSDPTMAYEKLELMLPTLDPARRRRAVSLLEQAGHTPSTADLQEAIRPMSRAPADADGDAGDAPSPKTSPRTAQEETAVTGERDSSSKALSLLDATSLRLPAERLRVVDDATSTDREPEPVAPGRRPPDASDSVISAAPEDPEDASHEAREIFDVVEDLQRCLEASRRTAATLREELAATRLAREEASNTARSRAQENERLRRDLEDLQIRNDGLTVELGSSESERSEAIREIRRLRLDQDAVKSTAEAYRDKSRRLEDAYAMARQVAADDALRLQQIVDDLKRNQEMLRERLDTRTRDLFEARATIDDLDQAVQKLRADVVRLERSRATISKIQRSLQDVRQQVLRPAQK